MVLVAPRSAKLVETRGARFTLLCGYVFLLLAFVAMLLLWKEGSPYWKIGLAYVFIGIGVGFAGTPASHSLTGSVPVRRAGMASGTADLQRDLGGAIMQSIFGALLTAGYAAAAAAAIAGAPNTQQVNDSVQNQLTKSFAGAEAVAQQYPQYASQITAAAKQSFLDGADWPVGSCSSAARPGHRPRAGPRAAAGARVHGDVRRLPGSLRRRPVLAHPARRSSRPQIGALQNSTRDDRRHQRLPRRLRLRYCSCAGAALEARRARARTSEPRRSPTTRPAPDRRRR